MRAFPCEQHQTQDGQWNQSFEAGMSLRDYFAAKVLQGLCANNSVIGYSAQTGWALVNCTPDVLCQTAYGFADAMMEARKEPPQ